MIELIITYLIGVITGIVIYKYLILKTVGDLKNNIDSQNNTQGNTKCFSLNKDLTENQK